MKIEFIKIEIQNFKSVGEQIVFNYEDLKGLSFVYGKNCDVPSARNGSGKSCICVDSLAFALFGKTLKNTNNKYIPNRFIDEKLKPSVKVYLRSDGQLYSCETFGKISGGKMGTIGMEVLKLNDDYSINEDVTQSSLLKTKEYVQNTILGCSFNIFKSSILISSADFMNFYEGMGKEQKRKYIETIFNLDCFGTMFTLVKSDLNDTKKEITSSKTDILKLVDKLKELNTKYSEFNETLENKKTSLKSKIINKVKEIKTLEAESSSIIVESTESVESNLNEINSSINSLLNKYSQLEKKKMSNEFEIKHIKEMIKEMNSISNGLCSSCIEIVNNRYDYSNKLKKIEEDKAIISAIDEKCKELNKEIEAKKIQSSDINKKVKEIFLLKQKKERADMSISFAKSELKNLNSSYEELKNEMTNPFESLIEETKNSLKSLKERLAMFIKNNKHLEILKEACSENGIKKLIIKDIVRLLNSLIQKYLNEIGSEFIVYFDETFEFKFLTTTGECEFNSFSAGERQRIQIATILAFRDLILNGKISSNIFIIDELLDANVDTICIENVMSILKRKSIEMHQNIFIISHRSELADNEAIWDNIIKITKENGQSYYEVK